MNLRVQSVAKVDLDFDAYIDRTTLKDASPLPAPDYGEGRQTPRGAKLVGEVVQYEDAYRLCYIRGPEGILIALAQELG